MVNSASISARCDSVTDVTEILQDFQKQLKGVCIEKAKSVTECDRDFALSHTSVTPANHWYY